MKKIIVDSGCDTINFHPAGKDVEFARVPLSIISGDREYLDTPDLDIRTMLDEVTSSSAKSSTACPSPNAFLEAYQGASEIYVVTITGRLSGSYGSAKLASEMFLAENPHAKVHVFDSLSAGPEMTLILYKLSALLCEGLDFETVVQQVADYMKHTGLFFILNNVDTLVSSGRLPKIVGLASGILGISLLGRASTEGKLEPMHKYRGINKGAKIVLSSLQEEGFNGKHLIIAHNFNEDNANQIRKTVLEIYPSAKIELMLTSGLCGYYSGKQGMLIGFEKN